MKYTIPTILLAAGSLQASEFKLDLNAHLNAAVGAASTDEAALATHAHDPNDEFTIQGLELNASARYGQYLSGFVAYNTFLDDSNSLDGELEEAFLKLTNLPFGTEIRAGRLFNRFGSQNSQHQHGWDFADADLLTTRFLGDEGLVTNSVELSYRLPIEHTALLSVAYGNAIPHDEHGEEEEGEDHGIEGEGALAIDDIFSVRLKGVYNHTDFRQFTYGVSALWGDNEFGKTTGNYSADLTYAWRENGLEPGGKSFRATIEPIYRDFDFASEDGDEKGSASEWGVHTQVGYGFSEDWDLGLRFDYLEGVGGPVEELDERHRTSLALTRRYQHSDNLGGHVRLQYNHDWHEQLGQEDSIWLQFQIDFGSGNEVR